MQCLNTKKSHNGLNLDDNQKEDERLAQIITKLIEKEKPHTVQQLLDLAMAETSRPEEDMVEQITRLQDKGMIKLEETPRSTPQTLSSYLGETEAYWYWTTIALSLATTLCVLTIAEDAHPLAYIRYVLGSVFILFLPGYGLTKALFPTHTPFQTSSKALDSAIRIALSIGLSLAIVPVMTLLLDYTTLGVRLTPILLSVLAVTLVSSTIGVAREHHESRTTKEERYEHDT
jgi:hypothetical protein